MILLDTHVLVWLVEGDRRLGPAARRSVDDAAASGEAYVSAITAWELSLLARKGRLVLDREPRDWIASALSLPGLAQVPIDHEIASEAALLPEPMHADPADRFLAATARLRGWSLMTADRALLDYGGSGYVQIIDAGV